MKPRELPPVELLREWLIYTPETGEIVWAKNRPYRKNSGKSALGQGNTGYYQIKFQGVCYQAHRIAYALYHGVDPYPDDVDHRNRVKTDNRIDNLRLTTRQQNCYNTKHKNNTSGCNGVTWKKKLQKWEVNISVNYERIYLGVYDTLDEAIEARLKAEDNLNVYVYREG
jgi:hypothetical protein